MDELRGDGRAGITSALVRELVAEQAPQWADLPVRPVAADGWDNRTYRLGDELSVRLPTAPGYVPAIAKEDRWLPVLGPHLPVPVPQPVFTGAPGAGFPHPWSVRRWLSGEPASTAGIADPVRLATEVGEFLLALQDVDATGGPVAGEHSFYRGAPPSAYDEQTRQHLHVLDNRRERDLARAVWDEAVAAAPSAPPVWFHGDVAVGNLLVRDGSLVAVIDFGTSGVGDPACDLVLAWTSLGGPGRRRFAEVVGGDEQLWARARGWALWKELITIPGSRTPEVHRRIVRDVLADPVVGRS
ncbi:aminoglycoside phosphotransferase family protein [Motilibacter peucedani]|nr:aminoglycoside phosphotransferase family protein [Motilibacter peucedani]